MLKIVWLVNGKSFDYSQKTRAEVAAKTAPVARATAPSMTAISRLVETALWLTSVLV